MPKKAIKHTPRGLKQDRTRVSEQKPEIRYETQKVNITPKKLAEVKKQVGVSRKRIEAKLPKKKSR